MTILCAKRAITPWRESIRSPGNGLTTDRMTISTQPATRHSPPEKSKTETHTVIIKKANNE
jgi:hypothetical protein